MAYLLRLGVEKFGAIIADGSIRKRDPSDESTSLEDLVYKVRNNSTTQIRLGWQKKQFIRTKAHVTLLENALKVNESVTDVSIGWHLRDQVILCILLKSLSKHCQLLNFRLILDVWLPEFVITNFLSSQPKLKSLEFRSIQMKKRNAIAKNEICSSDDNNRTKMNLKVNPQTEYGGQSSTHTHTINKVKCFSFKQSAVNSRNYNQLQSNRQQIDQYMLVETCDVIVKLNDHHSLQRLHLADCNLTDKQVMLLADFIQSRGGIDDCSLRMNNKIGRRGLKAISQAPVRKTLDLSLCDLKERHAVSIAEGIGAREYPLGNLLLCGNYEIGTNGLIALLEQNVCNNLVGINVSYCDIDNYRACTILQSLINLSSSTALREVFMQGSDVKHPKVVSTTCKLLQTSTSLRVLKMNDPCDPTKVMNAEQLRCVLDGLKDNFEIEYLDIDCSKVLTAERQVWCEIMFHLNLNRAGRRILITKANEERGYRHDSQYKEQSIGNRLCHKTTDDWFQVLCNAGKNEDLSVLYWIVRQGLQYFRT